MFLDRFASPASLLRTVLWCDAASSAAMGLGLIAGAGLLAAPLGLPEAPMRAIGIGFLPFAAFAGWLASRPLPPRAGVWLVIAINIVWVIESLALLASDGIAPTPLGSGFVLLQAAAVAVLAGLEWTGLRRCRGAVQAA
ncbi:hypothetical protein [Rivibacter subsaxonicus]|uniref:Uncharacterized protein n=1 Tax=Rivibacter subsaxonicus TaxID=457575 RepID=A0A4V2FUH5_9BURK|nr:hypothetical protein [Rivibacter subsaxonicus]RZU02086.1 hypothetical protein EV670_0105 [Rivibacter subsaxonicus]